MHVGGDEKLSVGLVCSSMHLLAIYTPQKQSFVSKVCGYYNYVTTLTMKIL